MKKKLFFNPFYLAIVFLNFNFGQGPTDVPSAPAEETYQVVSIYSDSYTSVITNANPDWGQIGTINTDFDPLGDGSNKVLALENFNYQGMDITASNLSAMEFLHIDVWVATGTDRLLKVTPINSGSGAGDILIEVPLTPGMWNSVDLPKSAFTDMTWDNVIQMKFDGQFNGDGSANATGYNVYLDNIYFYRQLSTSSTPTNVPSAPVVADGNVVSIYSDSYTSVITNANPDWGQIGTINTDFDPLGDGSNKVLALENFNYQGMDITASNLSAMEFLHIDVWVATGTDRLLKVTPINSGSGAGDILIEVPLTPGMWNSVDLPKSAFTDMTWDNVIQMKFDGQFNGDGSANATGYNVYLDNIYFWTSVTTPAPLVINDFNTPGQAGLYSSGGEWYEYEEVDHPSNFSNLSQLQLIKFLIVIRPLCCIIGA